MNVELNEKIPVVDSYDVIVAGVASALAIAREGKKVMLIEKNITLGGLATIGLINFFVPMCNGRGTQIIKGMADEFLHLSTKHSWDNMPKEWQKGNPEKSDKTRLVAEYSPSILALEFTKILDDAGVKIMFDTVVTKPVMDGKHCKGLVVENKSGRQFYECKMVVDTTGDCDILRRGGVPTLLRKNYHFYRAYEANLKSCQKAIDSKDISKIYDNPKKKYNINLYGHGQPEEIPLYDGTDANDVNRYIISNQKEVLDGISNDDRFAREIITLPSMVQFRTTRCIDGNHVFTEKDAYKHFDDSISAICDFDRRDYLYEVPYGTLVKDGFDNLITAGRSACASGYGWDVLRVIPPAIVTGQASGLACCQAIDDNLGIDKIDVKKLQDKLISQNVMIHFDDELIPKDIENSGQKFDVGHE